MPRHPLTKPIRLLLADDHAMVRESLQEALAREPDLTVVGAVGDGLTAVEQAQKLRPDIVLMDVTMPGLDGVEATRKLRKTCPEVRVLALSAHFSPVIMDQMRRAGAAGYVCKTSDCGTLLFALRRVARGGVYFDPELLSEAVGLFLAGADESGNPRVPGLSSREVQVLRALALGHTAKATAASLNIGVKSVESYKARLMVKLGMRTRVELVQYAQACGLAQSV